MKAPEGAPPWLAVCTAAERPDLWERARTERVFERLWPEYNLHSVHGPRYFGSLVPRFAHLQAIFVDRRTDELVARARTIPFRWDGALDTLPRGIDQVGLQAVGDTGRPSALCALSAEVGAAHQRTGLSAVVLATMGALAREAGLAPLVAPVRPSWKDRFPLRSIEDYVAWTRRDGLPYDPWIRVHIRLGARILRAEQHSMEFEAPLSDWVNWTGVCVDRDGHYIFPAGLARLAVTGGTGRYWEPNVWMLHRV